MARTIKTMDYAEQMWQWAHRSSGLPKPRADFQKAVISTPCRSSITGERIAYRRAEE